MEEDIQIPKWECTIRKADNGFILCFLEENREREIIFEINDERDEYLSEKQAFQKLFWQLMEYFGVHNSKHEEHRLEVQIKKQK
jgi:translation elongation factor EF-Ts